MNNQALNRNLRIYWNNPQCMNKAIDVKLTAKALKWQQEKGNYVDFDHYGLIEEMLLDERLEKDLSKGNIDAQVIVSSDMQLFHRKDLLLGNLHLFQSIDNWFPIRTEFAEMAHPQGFFQPCLAVPVVLIKNQDLLQGKEDFGWEDLLDPALKGKIALANPTRPAGKSVIKGFWYLFGEQGLECARQNCIVLSNPAAIFDAVDRGEYPLGIVPLLFASGRGKSGKIQIIWPQEGVLSIISYVAVKNGVELEIKEFLEESLFSEEIQSLYSQRGLMIPAHPQVKPHQDLEKQIAKLIYPSWDWVESHDMNILEENRFLNLSII